MKNLIKPYRHLLSLLAVIMLAIAGACLGIVNPGVAFFFVGLWQLSQIAMSKRTRCVYITALTEEQVKEFGTILESFKGYGTLFKDLDAIAKAEGGFTALKKLPELLKAEQGRVDQLETNYKKLSKTLLNGVSDAGVRWLNGVPFLSERAAKALASDTILQVNEVPGMLPKLISDEARRQKFVNEARAFAGIVEKAGGALSTSDIPMPTIYMPQVVELVFAYGQARKNATIFPLGAGTVKLPRLLAGEDSFAFLGAGTAGNSQAIAEKEVQAALVTFTANKMGGLIRIPTEIEEDTFIALGQFLARYIARQFALLEDKTLFLADGTSTYASISGVAKYCQTNTDYLQVLATTHTSTGAATIADFRAMRTLVNAAVLANMNANGRSSAAYYLHPSFEALLVTFNTINNPLIYVRQADGTCTLDGYPVRWIGVSAVNSATATISTPFCFFGDLSYWYLAERGAPRVEVSREVFFATDELAMRALERIDVEAMAIDAVSTLQTAAS